MCGGGTLIGSMTKRPYGRVFEPSTIGILEYIDHVRGVGKMCLVVVVSQYRLTCFRGIADAPYGEDVEKCLYGDRRMT